MLSWSSWVNHGTVRNLYLVFRHEVPHNHFSSTWHTPKSLMLKSRIRTSMMMVWIRAKFPEPPTMKRLLAANPKWATLRRLTFYRSLVVGFVVSVCSTFVFGWWLYVNERLVALLVAFPHNFLKSANLSFAPLCYSYHVFCDHFPYLIDWWLCVFALLGPKDSPSIFDMKSCHFFAVVDRKLEDGCLSLYLHSSYCVENLTSVELYAFEMSVAPGELLWFPVSQCMCVLRSSWNLMLCCLCSFMNEIPISAPL